MEQQTEESNVIDLTSEPSGDDDDDSKCDDMAIGIVIEKDSSIPTFFSFQNIKQTIDRISSPFDEMLDDNSVYLIMHEILYNMYKSKMHQQTSLTYHIVDPQFTLLFLLRKRVEIEKQQKLNNKMKDLINGNKVLFFPVNGNFHWSLLVYYDYTKSFFYMDSLGKGHKEIIQSIESGINDIMKWSRKEIYHINTPIQKLGFECGYYVIMYTIIYFNYLIDMENNVKDDGDTSIDSVLYNFDKATLKKYLKVYADPYKFDKFRAKILERLNNLL